MAVATLSNSLRALTVNRHLLLRIVGVRYKNFSSTVKNEEQPLNDQKKPKRPFVPRITLISADNISITTLEEAQKISKRRDLKLVKIVDIDTKTQRPIYKLMTGTEYHAEELKQREQKKKERANDTMIKGEKVLILNASIGANDLKVNVNKIVKWLNKRYEARVVINGDGKNMEKAENIYKFLEDNLKDQAKFLQKRIKGNDIKFNINPPKKNKDDKVKDDEVNEIS